MAIKEIWKQFLDTTKEAGISAWEQVRKVAKSTFELFKTTLINAITGIFTWLWELISGVVVILWDLLKIVCSALMAAIKSTFGIVGQMIIDWIKKW